MALFGGGNDIRIRFLADTSDIGRGVQEAGSGISKGLGLAGLGWAAAGAAAVTFGKQSVDAALAAEDAQARLAAQYAKFPALHDVSLQALNDLADATLKKTRYDDEAARAAEGVLAQYHLTGQQILDLLPLVEDFAAKTGKDLPTAAEAIGKALLGSTRALKEVGINYKSTGDAAQDYANILQLLHDSVGGAAAVDADTTAGKLAMLKNQYGELQEKIGTALLPLLQQLAPALIWVLEVLQTSLTGWMLLWEKLGPLADSVGQAVASVLQTIVGVAQWVIQAFNDISAAVAWAAGIVSGVFGGAISFVTGLLNAVVGAISDVVGWIGGAFSGAWDTAAGAVNGVASAIGWVIDKLHALKGVWDSVGGIISKIGGIIGLSAPVSPPGSSGAPALALAGGGSARALSGGGGVAAAVGLTVNVNVHGNVGDPNLIGRRVVDALATYTRTNGSRALRTNLGLV